MLSRLAINVIHFLKHYVVSSLNLLKRLSFLLIAFCLEFEMLSSLRPSIIDRGPDTLKAFSMHLMFSLSHLRNHEISLS